MEGLHCKCERCGFAKWEDLNMLTEVYSVERIDPGSIVTLHRLAQPEYDETSGTSLYRTRLPDQQTKVIRSIQSEEECLLHVYIYQQKGSMIWKMGEEYHDKDIFVIAREIGW